MKALAFLLLISKVAEHPALDQTTQGIVATMEKEGFHKGKNFDYRVESAQANMALAGQIAAKFNVQKPNVVVGVGTMTSLSLAKYARAKGGSPLVFSSVTDPVGAGLTGENITGVSNFVPLEPQLELFKKVLPSIKRLGFLYNPGEFNSVSILQKLEKVAAQYNLTIIKQAATKTADVPQAAIKLASGSDAIYVSNDSTALSALQSVVKATEKAKIPLFLSDTDAVKIGAVLALGPNQYSVGEQTGLMVARIMRGEKASAIPVEYPKETDLFLNLTAAKKIGLPLSEEIIKTAKVVYP